MTNLSTFQTIAFILSLFAVAVFFIVFFLVRARRGLGQFVSRQDSYQGEEESAGMGCGRLFYVGKFDGLLQKHIDAASHTSDTFSVVLIKIRDFDSVFQCHGSHIGDQILLEVSDRIADAFPSASVQERLSETVFAVVCARGQRCINSVQIASDCINSLSRPVRLDARLYEPTFAVGVCSYPVDGQTSGELSFNAELALRDALTAAAKLPVLFQPELRDAYQRDQQLLQHIRQGINRGEFVVFFRPRVSLDTGDCEMLESNLCWNHPHLGLQQHDAFVTHARTSGLMSDIIQSVLDKISVHCHAWRERGVQVPGISIAVTQDVLVHHRIVGLLQQTAVDLASCGARLEVELDGESLVGSFGERVKQALREVQSFGVEVVVRDFDTGRIPLAVCNELPINAVKFSPTLTRGISQNRHSRHTVSTILDFAHGLNIKTIAQGVESDEELAHLAALGCQSAQGNLIATSMSADATRRYFVDGGFAPQYQPDIDTAVEDALTKHSEPATMRSTAFKQS